VVLDQALFSGPGKPAISAMNVPKVSCGQVGIPALPSNNLVVRQRRRTLCVDPDDRRISGGVGAFQVQNARGIIKENLCGHDLAVFEGLEGHSLAELSAGFVGWLTKGFCCVLHDISWRWLSLLAVLNWIAVQSATHWLVTAIACELLSEQRARVLPTFFGAS